MGTVIKESRVFEGSSADAPVKVVLTDKGGDMYVSHLENQQTSGKFWGHYFDSLELALVDYYDRLDDLMHEESKAKDPTLLFAQSQSEED